MDISAYKLAQRFVGIRELADDENHPLIRWWASLCFDGNLDIPDSVAWCSSFANGIAWELRLPRSKSAMARSWLKVGSPITIGQARAENDVVILWRGSPDGASGHVGFFAGVEGEDVLILGGNQGDQVAIDRFPQQRILGIRRLA